MSMKRQSPGALERAGVTADTLRCHPGLSRSSCCGDTRPLTSTGDRTLPTTCACPRTAARRAGTFLFLTAIGLLAACGRHPPADLPGAGSEPAEAVRVLAGRLQANDLPGFARAALPPTDYAAVDAAWRAGRSRWPISELPLSTRLPGLLATLAAPGAEARLQQSFDGQLAGQGADLKSAARSLTLFGAQYLRKQPQYTAAQRAYYIAIVKALGNWGAHAPLGDRGRARAALKRLTASARRTGLYSEADFSAAGLDGSLTRLAPFAADVKAVLGTYDLALDETFADLRTGLVSQKGDVAVVRIEYPLAGVEIPTTVRLLRRGGHWYPEAFLQEAARVSERADAAVERPVEQGTAAAKAAVPAAGP